MRNLIIILASLLFCSGFFATAWGFYGHRKINRMAVFSLPQEMIGFYKKNIEFVTDHAVDPDKRRYATKHEAVRHYIDIDHWGTFPFDEVPRTYMEAILWKADIKIISAKGDSLDIELDELDSILVGEFKREVRSKLEYSPDENPWHFDLPRRKTLYIKDNFSEYGVLPYWMKQYQAKLVSAFKAKDKKKILRISAEMGHYIGDAHVPLHTTENYNGQLSDQVGIHAFWETRIPELFADEDYDFYVGKAEYIEDVQSYFWEVVLESHKLLEDVLQIEKDLSQIFESDKMWCYEDRLSRTIRTQCPAYAKAYAAKMDGMVEVRMRDAILSLSSLWYTAWVNAGQPDLDNFDRIVLSDEERKKQDKLDRQFKEGNILGREHSEGNR